MTEIKKEKKPFLQKLGPGLITGVSDDDPSGIATYSQIGAQFGFQLLWTMVFSYPLMCSIQEISARIGRVTGLGIAGNIRAHYSKKLLYPVITLLVGANVINLGADIGAMGAALKLLIGGSAHLYCLAFTIFSVVLQIMVPYTKYVRILKWLTLSLLTYVATVFAVHVSWGAALKSTFIPTLSFNSSSLQAFVALLGTTISPYLFFWQASEEVEDVTCNPNEQALLLTPEEAPSQFSRIRLDTYLGMGISNLIAFFIILTTAVTFHLNGKTDIQTATDAAEALRPIAGNFCFFLFSCGIVGTGLLAVPILAGSASYAVAETLEWPYGLERNALEARGFYFVIGAATVIGLALNFIGFDPIKALFWSAMLNGVISAPILFIIMLLASNEKAMGKFTLTPGLKVLGWVTTFVMTIASLALIITSINPSYFE